MAMSGLTSLGSTPTGSSGVETISNLLMVVLDLNPFWWGEQLDSAGKTAENGNNSHPQYSLAHSLDQILIFLNSYLLVHPGNKVVMLGCMQARSHFLYPAELTDTPADVYSDSRPESFRIVNHTVQRAIQHIIQNTMADSDVEAMEKRESVFVGALSRSLCYIHRMQRESPKGQMILGRLLVIEAGQDSSSHYMHFINTVFTAQKMNVKIDACVLGDDSILLQQAVDLTGGLYVKVENPGGIVQILNSIFLLEAGERSKMSVPEKVQVDYRAACFCHQKLIEVGYVCSVCLSVFCAFSPMCSTCQSTFKFMTGIRKRKPTDLNTAVSSPGGLAQNKKARNGGAPESNGKP